MSRLLQSEWTRVPTIEELFAESAIKDDFLRMMFTCCHPRLPEEAQVALALHILCGFSVAEVAGAFITSHAAIEKRIPRAKKILAASKNLFDIDDAAEFAARLPAVHRALYLLFNEGYHGASAESAVRADLCHEAMRLTALLLQHPFGETTATYALSALMCFLMARLPARFDGSGKLLSLFDQNRTLWDRNLVAEGLQLLGRSASGSTITEYHIEAAIASIHATAPRTEDTNWDTISSLYDTLVALRPSPVVALNRAIAIGQRDGPERGLEELRAIPNAERLANYPFYHAAFGESELRSGRPEIAREHFRAARGLARNQFERSFLNNALRRVSDQGKRGKTLQSLCENSVLDLVAPVFRRTPA